MEQLNGTMPATIFKNTLDDVSDEMQRCIQNCVQCAETCEQLIQYCLAKGGAHAEREHIRLLQDCAEICAASYRFMLRGSRHHTKTCGVCAEVCLDCAVDCERMTEDPMMKNCADLCRRCAESCRQMTMAH